MYSVYSSLLRSILHTTPNGKNRRPLHDCVPRCRQASLLAQLYAPKVPYTAKPLWKKPYLLFVLGALLCGLLSSLVKNSFCGSLPEQQTSVSAEAMSSIENSATEVYVHSAAKPPRQLSCCGKSGKYGHSTTEAVITSRCSFVILVKGFSFLGFVLAFLAEGFVLTLLVVGPDSSASDS